MFDMSIAITYLFNSRESGVQSYIGNKMFGFRDKDVDFYLPQLVNMYIQSHDVAYSIHPYLAHRFALMSRVSAFYMPSTSLNVLVIPANLSIYKCLSIPVSHVYV